VKAILENDTRMLDQFCAAMEAVNPERDWYRVYRIEAGTDLLGHWLVEITFGRIGRAGHRSATAFGVNGQPENW